VKRLFLWSGVVLHSFYYGTILIDVIRMNQLELDRKSNFQALIKHELALT